MIATAIRIDETYRCTQQRLWAVLTDPDELSGWLGGACAIEPHVGGAVRIAIPADGLLATGEVRAFEPPRPDRAVAMLEHTFVDEAHPAITSVCRWAVVDQGESCTLHFAHDGFDEQSRSAVTGAWTRLGHDDGEDAGAGDASSIDDATALLASARRVLLVSFIGPEVPTALLAAGFDVVARTGPGAHDWARCALDDGGSLATVPCPPPIAVDLVHLDWDAFDEYVDVAVRLGARTIWYHSARTRPPEPHDDRGCWVPATQSAAQRWRAEEVGIAYVDRHDLADVARRIS